MKELPIIRSYSAVKKKWSSKKRLGFFIVAIVILLSFIFFLKIEKTFSYINHHVIGKSIHLNNTNTPQEKNRIDILILGLRGEGDVEAGDNLTDTMMVLSIKTDVKKASLISVPRDLYIQIPRYEKMEKINFAYAYGENVYGDGLDLSRLAVEKVTGINIDYTVAINFPTFVKIIDLLGGVDVYVPHDFSESKQWGENTFFVPKGWNHMNSETALYYSRSRYSSSDFDRARRQHDVLVAVAKKATSLGIVANPVKLNAMLDGVAAGVKTDIGFMDGLKFLSYTKLVTSDSLIRKTLDTTDVGLLSEGFVNSSYVLYPKVGLENYSQIHALFQNIFN